MALGFGDLVSEKKNIIKTKQEIFDNQMGGMCGFGGSNLPLSLALPGMSGPWACH